MKLALAALLLSGCLFEDDTYGVGLEGFDGPVLSFHQEAAGHVSLAVDLLAKDYSSPCPILEDTTATVDGVALEIVRTGGSDVECNAALLRLPDVPMTPGLSVILDSPGEHIECPFDDRHLDAGIELVDGGTWERPSAAQTIRVRFGRPLEGYLYGSAIPVDDPGRDEFVDVTSEPDGVYTLRIPMLPPRPYVLRIAETSNAGASGRCEIATGVYASAPLTIVPP